MKYYKKILILILFIITISLFCKNSFAGVSHVLSRNADYSTDDHAFLTTDTLYVQVTQNILDYREIKKSFFTLKSHQTKIKPNIH